MPPRRFLAYGVTHVPGRLEYHAALIPAGIMIQFPIRTQVHRMNPPARTVAPPKANLVVLGMVLASARAADPVFLRVPPDAVLDAIHVPELDPHDSHTLSLSQET